jgi:hypothetical protein
LGVLPVEARISDLLPDLTASNTTGCRDPGRSGKPGLTRFYDIPESRMYPGGWRTAPPTRKLEPCNGPAASSEHLKELRVPESSYGYGCAFVAGGSQAGPRSHSSSISLCFADCTAFICEIAVGCPNDFRVVFPLCWVPAYPPCFASVLGVGSCCAGCGSSRAESRRSWASFQDLLNPLS